MVSNNFNIYQPVIGYLLLLYVIQVSSQASQTGVYEDSFQNPEQFIWLGCNPQLENCTDRIASKPIQGSGVEEIDEEIDEEIKNFIRGKEEVVGILATEAEFAFRLRSTLIADCTCIPNRCSNVLGPDAQCGIDLGNSSFCGNTQGTMYSMDSGTTGIALPSESPTNLSSGLKASICLMNHLESTVIPALTTRNISSWSYFGTEQGAIWTFPGRIRTRNEALSDMKQWNYCEKYDPRTRPWYHEGATGPLDIVMAVDISDSMNEIVTGVLSRWDIVRDSLIKFVDTMTFTDSFNIVFFNNVEEDDVDKKKLWDGLLPGTLENRNKAKDVLLNDIFPQSGTNFEYAFDSAFKALKTAVQNNTSNNTSNNCEKVILFLTDGKDNDLERNKNRTADLINQVSALQDDLQLQSDKRARIFSFSIGKLADDTIGRQLSCMHNGAWAEINAQDDPLTVLNTFLKFIAVARNTSRIYWSEEYEDASGLGKMITAVTPVYSPRNDINIPGALIGVAGHDMLVEEIKQLAGDKTSSLIQQLQQSSKECDQVTINSCMQQVLRGQEGECPDISYQSAACTKFNDKYYQKSKQRTTWEVAKEECYREGGVLSLPADLDEQGFLAGQAAFEGSWVGLQYNLTHWVQQDQSQFDFYNQQNLFWAPREGSSLGRLCATIAPTGTTKNMYMQECQEEFTFICEFEEQPSSCIEGLVDVGEVGYEYVMPRIQQCSAAESLESVRFLDDVELPDIQPEDLFCYDDFSKPSFKENFQELICCDDFSKGLKCAIEASDFSKGLKCAIEASVYINCIIWAFYILGPNNWGLTGIDN
eukprot:TRINITY_DN444_c0_g2_i11.p1 TRINITY_DN444_c0_g2~~TRINITY_DN444_c0_g2_i11.p1  ORF type:complete len:816 (-),score=129.60 TRINITY_DN444_c0_g2_i11:103-2550(-)